MWGGHTPNPNSNPIYAEKESRNTVEERLFRAASHVIRETGRLGPAVAEARNPKNRLNAAMNGRCSTWPEGRFHGDTWAGFVLTVIIMGEAHSPHVPPAGYFNPSTMYRSEVIRW